MDICQLLSAEHPDAYKLFLGEAPDSYRNVAHSIVVLLKEYNQAEAGSKRHKQIKDCLFRVAAHCDFFVTNEPKRPGVMDLRFPDRKGFDIGVKEWFSIIQIAAQELMHLETAKIEATVPKNGQDKDLQLKKKPKEGPLQDKFVPYLATGFNKYIKEILAQEHYSVLDGNELKVLMLLLHSDYLDHCLQNDPQFNKVNGGEVTTPLNKDHGRAMVKVLGDYVEETNPIAHLQDVVRRSIVTTTLEAQTQFIDMILAISRDKVKPFQMMRYKSTMTKNDDPVKFTIVNVLYTPSLKEASGKFEPITFLQMVFDPEFLSIAKKRQQRDKISNLYMEAAKCLLCHHAIKNKSIAAIIEIQLYLEHFLEMKKRAHVIYKFLRPTSAAHLTRDLVKYAINKDMAFMPKEGQWNEIAKEKAKEILKRAGFGILLRTTEHGSPVLPLAGAFDTYRSKHKWSKQFELELPNVVLNFCQGYRIAILRLDKNCIVDVTGISRSLKHNNTLKNLSLSGNLIVDVSKMGEALQHNKTLITLNLSDNKFSDTSTILTGLQNNSTLKILNLRFNFISEADKKSLILSNQGKRRQISL